MNIDHVIIDNQFSIKNMSIEQGISSKPANPAIPTYTKWYINYKYPDDVTKKLLFVTDHIKLIKIGAIKAIEFQTELNGANSNHVYMINMMDTIIETIKKTIIAKYGSDINFCIGYNHARMRVLTRMIKNTCITPIIIQQSKKKGGNKIQIKDLSLADTETILKHEIKPAGRKVKQYMMKTGDDVKDIHYECKFVLGFEILLVEVKTPDVKQTCIIKLVAKRVDIKYNVTKTLTSIDRDITIMVPQEGAIKKLEI